MILNSAVISINRSNIPINRSWERRIHKHALTCTEHKVNTQLQKTHTHTYSPTMIGIIRSCDMLIQCFVCKITFANYFNDLFVTTNYFRSFVNYFWSCWQNLVTFEQKEWKTNWLYENFNIFVYFCVFLQEVQVQNVETLWEGIPCKSDQTEQKWWTTVITK